MLNYLRKLTNSQAFIDRGHLRVIEVHSRPEESADVWLTLDTRVEDEHTYEETAEVWRIRCVEATYCFGNSLRDYKRPYNQLRVYANHPVLLNYQSEVEFEVQGQCTSVPALLGSLYEVHGEACGHWVDFSLLFFHLAKELQAQQRAFLRVPASLLPTYTPVFQQYGLIHTAEESGPSAWLNLPRRVLLFSNPVVCPDTFNLAQPYQVAQYFEEQRIA